jgi:hypothetical protein
MGFMDKAKKLAEQAQQKLDEAQKNFNQSASPQSQPDAGGVRYDEHGRPIQEAPPADPAASTPPAEPRQEPQPGEPPPPAPPPAAETGDQADASPDPFKPLQQ